MILETFFTSMLALSPTSPTPLVTVSAKVYSGDTVIAHRPIRRRIRRPTYRRPIYRRGCRGFCRHRHHHHRRHRHTHTHRHRHVVRMIF